MDKYEISLWEDYPDIASNGSEEIPFLNERKLCVIGSNTMKSSARALEPCLISNVNGTHTFSFKIYYRFKDEITGENIINPFLPYIINERKVKVFWKNVWYDFVIKKIEEDSQKKYIICTCEDSFITELSKNGYELEFNSKLQNNSGTAAELATKVLEGSGWQLSTNPLRVIQYHEEAVYEASTRTSFNAIKQSPNGDTIVTIPSGKLCLLFQSTTDEENTEIQFLYSENGYSTDTNDMIVTNGDCYKFTGIITQNGNQISIYRTEENVNQLIFRFDISTSFSSRYRAKRLVNSQLTIFDELLNRYVDVYNNGNVYGYKTIEYSDPTLVINLLANTSDFTDTKGWIGRDLTWQVYPPFTNQSQVTTYSAKSYLQISSGYTYNSAFVSNKKHLTPNSSDIKNGILGGFQVGEQYIFRYKAKNNLADNSYISSGITGNVYKFNNTDYTPINTSQPYFKVVSGPTGGGNKWVEYVLECQKACPANELEIVGFFINAASTCWIENIEFFKLSYGLTSYDTTVESRIEPGMIALQSIGKIVYRYYNADHDGVDDAKDLKFLYQSTTKSDTYVPVYNNYEKITSIEESKSNRFNILQSIAEKFECWVRFDINHNQETGQVLYDENGLPQKYVSLVEQIGHDTGISFEYGIDLTGIKRTIVSNTIATKAIIIPNENQFGKNGFCTIARSQLNYPRENFIINFDYYINQGLLDKNTVEADLYKVNGNNLGYYFYLNRYNREYDELADAVNNKKIELVKQQAELKVQTSNQRAALERLDNNKSDIMSLANVTTWADAQSYTSSHANNRKVQSLMGSIAQLNNEISNLNSSIPALENSVTVLENYIDEKIARMEQLVELTSALHKAFFKKYARYLQEGTWQDSNYVEDDEYYLDGLEVAYRSSRPQIQYNISLIRVSGLEDFSSKVFDVGDICYIQDREFFGYEEDKITPYKQRVIISELTSYFDSPEKDVIKVQNYKTQFDDLFHRITTTTQSLQFSQGSFERAAGVVKPDGTLSFGMLQDTFDYNKDLVLNSANQAVTWDNTGITVSDESNSALKVRIIAGGIFVSDDGGDTWKNAIRGDGISTDLLTAGRINTSEIFVYDGNYQSFRWDSQGINAYFSDPTDGTNFGKFVRFDRFGLYGYSGNNDFVPSTEDAIWDPNSDVKFGLTWRGFFLRGSNGGSDLEISDDGNGITFKMLNSIGDNSLEISTSEDIVLKTGNIKRVQIGRLNPSSPTSEYGIWVRNDSGQNIFNVSSSGTNSIGGWTLTSDSFYHTDNQNNTIGLYSTGKSTTIQNNTASYYILAGNKFGVTIDGSVYSSSGKIGGWIIDSTKLTGGNITIDSSGNINCYVNSDKKWELDNLGNLFAKNGEIAGWQFTSNGLYNKSNGTWINSGTPGSSLYTIDTNSLRAIGGSIGGWVMSTTGLTGGTVSLGSDGTLSLGASGKLTAGDVTISANKITINGTTISGYSNGTLSINPNLRVTGKIDSVGVVTASAGIYVPWIATYANNIGDGHKLTDTHFDELIWLTTNWGKITPNTVRVAGIDSTWINSWTAYKGTAFEQNGTWYLPVSGKAYIYGKDMNGNNHAATSNPTSSSADNLSTKNLIVTEVYTAGRNSKKTGTISTITSNGTYYASNYNLDGFSSISVSVSNNTSVSTINGPYDYMYDSSGRVNRCQIYIGLSNGAGGYYWTPTWSYS